LSNRQPDNFIPTGDAPYLIAHVLARIRPRPWVDFEQTTPSGGRRRAFGLLAVAGLMEEKGFVSRNLPGKQELFFLRFAEL
jgi:hypothetical protein